MKKHKTILVFLLLLAVGVLLSSLFHQAEPTNKSATRKFDTRRSGTRRIVCMTPSVTETVFALGCGEQVVGVTSFCNFPPEAKQKEKLGGFYNPNFERLIAVNPDVVITQGQSEKLSWFCRQENITLVHVRMSNVEIILEDIALLGQTLGCPERARQLCYDLRYSLDKTKSKLLGLEHSRVFFSLHRTSGDMTGLSSVGGDTFISELITIAGGRNIFNDVKRPYPQISKESLLKRNPDIIIEPVNTGLLTEQYRQSRRNDWQTFASIPAVKNAKIYIISDEGLLIPGPRIGQTARTMAKIIHPEIFSE